MQVDGYVTDTAFTAAFSSEGRSMADTAELALKTAIDNIHGDMALGKIGALIETTIKNRGFKPISNLTGHAVGRYLIHAGTSIPNVAGFSPNKVKTGEVYAIEPFVTVARCDWHEWMMAHKPPFTAYLKAKSVKTDAAKKMLKHIETNFQNPALCRTLAHRRCTPRAA